MQSGTDLLAALADRADEADRHLAWPTPSWERLRRTQALGWSIPPFYGGEGRTGRALFEGYERLASACMTTTFLLSQRDAAIRRLCDSGRDDLCQQLLPSLARGDSFITVGLSHLTTSRQHVKPVLIAKADSTGFVLNGVIPWVSGAALAQHLVIGAVLHDGQQILLVVPTNTPGLSVGSPMELASLRGSMTAEVSCNQVHIGQDAILAGPAEKVMHIGKGGTGGLETSCLAIGLASSAINYLANEAQTRPYLHSPSERLQHRLHDIRVELYRLVDAQATPEETGKMRGEANTLVLQATQAALTAAKGVGFVHPHPAQLWARQSLFFLVWSCPALAASMTLEHLTCD